MVRPGATIGARRVAAVAVGLALLATGCSPPGVRWLQPDARQHDRAVEDLERRVAAEDGWVVVPVPNMHEGGGTTTWWLHPCDPALDTERPVTRTAYHGSDVMGLPGHHTVEDSTLTCSEPGSVVALDGGRQLQLDVDVADLGWSFGLLEARDMVVVTDLASAETVLVERGAASGPCDGRSSWRATLHSDRELSISAESCVATLAALPPAARDLLQPMGGSDAERDAGRLAEADVADFSAALEAAGWEAGTIILRDFDGSSQLPYWYGPCGHGLDGEDTRPEADWHAGHLSLRERPCE